MKFAVAGERNEKENLSIEIKEMQGIAGQASGLVYLIAFLRLVVPDIEQTGVGDTFMWALERRPTAIDQQRVVFRTNASATARTPATFILQTPVQFVHEHSVTLRRLRLRGTVCLA